MRLTRLLWLALFLASIFVAAAVSDRCCPAKGADPRIEAGPQVPAVDPPAPHRCTCGCEKTGRCQCPNCSVGCGFLPAPAKAAAPFSPWATDYDRAMAAAAASRTPIVCLVTGEFCPECRKLEAGALADPAVRGDLGGRVCIKVDCAKQPALARALGAAKVPYLIRADPDGKILGTLTGNVSAAGLRAFLTAPAR